jgi:hypothetical protein
LGEGGIVNIFNRVLVVLGLLVLGAVLVFGMLQPLLILQVLEQTTAWLRNVMYNNYMLYLGVIAGALLLLLVILWLEFRRRRIRAVRVQQVSSGDVTLSVSSIAQSLEYYVNALTGVVRVKPTISGRGKAVNVALDVETVPDLDVPATTDEICRVARDVIEGRLGLQLRKIRANVKQAPYPKGTRPQPLPSVAAPLPSYAATKPVSVEEVAEAEPFVTPYESIPPEIPQPLRTNEVDAEGGGEAGEYELPPFDTDEDSKE